MNHHIYTNKESEMQPYINNISEANDMITILHSEVRKHCDGKFIWMRIAIIEMFLLGTLSAIYI